MILVTGGPVLGEDFNLGVHFGLHARNPLSVNQFSRGLTATPKCSMGPQELFP